MWMYSPKLIPQPAPVSDVYEKLRHAEPAKFGEKKRTRLSLGQLPQSCRLTVTKFYCKFFLNKISWIQKHQSVGKVVPILRWSFKHFQLIFMMNISAPYQGCSLQELIQQPHQVTFQKQQSWLGPGLVWTTDNPVLPVNGRNIWT